MPKFSREKEEQRNLLMGLGEKSVSKSYYPELQKQMVELEDFRELMDRVDDGVFIIDADSGFIFDSSGALSRRVLGDTNIRDKHLFFQYLVARESKIFQKFLTENEQFNCEAQLFDKDDNILFAELSVRISKRQHKKRAIIVARDISDRKQAEELLQEMNKELEKRVFQRTQKLQKAERAKSDFISVVSHELRTPLTSILGFTRLIEKKLGVMETSKECHYSEAATKKMCRVFDNLSIILTEGDRLAGLIDDLLDISRLESKSMQYDVGFIELSTLLEHAKKVTYGLCDSAKTPLVLQCDEGIPAIEGDAERILQVLINLISNAVKFGKQEPIILSACRDEECVIISVQDHGDGVPEKFYNNVFDKFITVGHQGNMSLPQKGTGLGLTISRHIVEAHGGEIWFANLKSGGAVFSFSLPLPKA